MNGRLTELGSFRVRIISAPYCRAIGDYDSGVFRFFFFFFFFL